MTDNEEDPPDLVITMKFELPTELHARAITHPSVGFPSRRYLFLRNALATILFILTLYAAALGVWGNWAVAPTIGGGVIGAALMLAVVLKTRRRELGRHHQYNSSGGQLRLIFEPNGLTAERQHIKSQIAWPFVTGIISIDGATLIELPTARLTAPDFALPAGMSADAFRSQLEVWRQGRVSDQGQYN